MYICRMALCGERHATPARGALEEGEGRRNTMPSDYGINVLAELSLDIFNALSKLLLTDKSNDVSNSKSA